MMYCIKYAVACNTGRVRKANQDNFWCNGRYLEEVNNGLPAVYTSAVYCSDNPTFAIFDGMGGEQKGETAAYIAASTYDALQKNNTSVKDCNYLVKCSRIINSEICKFGSENGIRNTGSTGSMISFSKNHIYIANVGDSPILRADSGRVTQISVPHVLMPEKRKSPLTQYLGVPNEEFIIEPHTAAYPVIEGNRFLLCSDGVTDMVSEAEVAEILLNTSDIGEAAKKLLERALELGGVDNTTLILCEIKKVKLFGKSDI